MTVLPYIWRGHSADIWVKTFTMCNRHLKLFKNVCAVLSSFLLLFKVKKNWVKSDERPRILQYIAASIYCAARLVWKSQLDIHTKVFSPIRLHSNSTLNHHFVLALYCAAVFPRLVCANPNSKVVSVSAACHFPLHQWLALASCVPSQVKSWFTAFH